MKYLGYIYADTLFVEEYTATSDMPSEPFMSSDHYLLEASSLGEAERQLSDILVQ